MAIRPPLMNSEFVVKRTENFDFIEEDFPELYQLALQVERYYTFDHDCCLLKLRLYVELWCHIVANQLDLSSQVADDDNELDLHAQIQRLSSSAKLPPYLIKILNRIRIHANRGVHICHHANGQWGIAETVNANILEELVKDTFELAQYLAFSLQGLTVVPDVWQSPQSTAQVEYVYGALSGDGKAAYRLADQYRVSLEKEKNKKQQYQYQQDLAYWLQKSKQLQYHKSDYLYAYCYVNKLLPLPKQASIKMYLDQALVCDPKGKSAFLYYAYLHDHGEPKRALSLLILSAERGHSDALCLLLRYFYHRDDTQYHYWVEKAVDSHIPLGYLLECEIELDKWQKHPQDEATYHRVRGLLLAIQNRQVDGWGFFEGWCVYYGHLGRQQDKVTGAELMAAGYGELPLFLCEEVRLFEVISNNVDYAELVIKIGPDVLYQLDDDALQKAQAQYQIAMMILHLLSKSIGISTPLNLSNLLRESARVGYEPARLFLDSPDGRAWTYHRRLRTRRVNHKSVDRNKQKKAKKLARRARQK